MSKRRPLPASLPPSLTVAFETLVDETVEQRSAVVAERRTRVGVYFELVTGRVLEGGEEKKNISQKLQACMHADFISSGGLSSVSVSCIRLAYHPFAPASFHFHLPGGRLSVISSVISHLCSLLDGGWTSFSRPLPALSPLPFSFHSFSFLSEARAR